MKTTKQAVTTVELDYADVAKSLADYNQDMLSDILFTLSAEDGRLSRGNAKRLALACLKGEDSEDFMDLIELADVRWINTPEELFGYVALVENFPLVFLNCDLLDKANEQNFVVWVGSYKANTKAILSNY
jgi:hypothetical protein